MTARLEWRTKGQGDDALLFIREYGEAGDTVMKTWDANQGRLTDFLNDMDDLETDFVGLETDVDHRDPVQFGQLVLSRAHIRYLELSLAIRLRAAARAFADNAIRPIDCDSRHTNIEVWHRISGIVHHAARD